MTLDILHFIDNKGGNAEEIRESQRKRGHSVEIVDEIISMYNEWVKCECWFGTSDDIFLSPFLVDFEANGLSKQVNAVQKEITAKKKARPLVTLSIS